MNTSVDRAGRSPFVSRGSRGFFAQACRGVIASALAALFGVAPASHATVYFAEPYTGQKVDNYQVTLPVSRDEVRSFAIPGQCDALIQAMSAGGMQWGSEIEKRVWIKVANDCRYHAFLHRFPNATPRDFISGYDFRNAALADLLAVVPCPDGGDAGCEGRAAGVSDISQLLQLVPPPEETQEFIADDCRLRQGSFRGEVIRDRQGLRCRYDRRSPGLRVIAVDHSDANGDGYLDAVLRVVPIGPGTTRMPLVVAFTRKGPEEPLTVLVPMESAMPLPSVNSRRGN